MNARTPEEMEANACLIAAAPDLLAVCQELLGRWDARGFYEISHEDLALRAAAAIAKAGGPALLLDPQEGDRK